MTVQRVLPERLIEEQMSKCGWFPGVPVTNNFSGIAKRDRHT